MIVLIVFGLIGLFIVVWQYFLSDLFEYRRARKVIIPFVKKYKWKCDGNNRFLVNVEVLQNLFREFNTSIIERVFDDLVNEGIVVRDHLDGEWCIK